MAKVSPIINNFNAGELSPLVSSREELKYYKNGVKYSRNMVHSLQGPSRKRNGTRFVLTPKTVANRSWLAKFQFNVAQSYVLEFGDQYIRFFTNHGQLQGAAFPAWNNFTNYKIGDLVSSGGTNYYCVADHLNHVPPNAAFWYAFTGTIYEIPSPYLIADLTASDGTFNLQLTPSNDVAYITSAIKTYPPYKLTRMGASSFKLERVAFTGGPFRSLNVTDNGPFPTITMFLNNGPVLSASADVLVVASLGLFNNSLVGQSLYIEQSFTVPTKAWEPGKVVAVNDIRRVDSRNYKALTAGNTGTVTPTHTEGVAFDGDAGIKWEYRDAGFGYGAITSVPISGPFQNVLGCVNNGAGLIRVQVNAHGFSTGFPVDIDQVTGTVEANGHWVITVIDANHFDLIGSVFVNAYVANGRVLQTNGCYANLRLPGLNFPDAVVGFANATTRWAFSEWRANNYPTVAAFFRERLMFGRDLSFWGSVAGDFENMSEKDGDGLIAADMALSGTIASDQGNIIRWMLPQDTALLAGTSGEEHAISEVTTSDPFGPGNVKSRKQSTYGSKNIFPSRVGSDVLYIQRSGRKLMVMKYDASIDRYICVDQTVLAEHITKGGIISMAYQQEPLGVNWMSKSDGSLVGFTVSEDQDVKGFHRHHIGGNSVVVESVVVIDSPDSTRNEVWLQVRRIIDGAVTRHIEWIDASRLDGDDPEDVFYVDAGLTLDNSQAVSLTPGAGATVVGSVGVVFTAGAAVFAAGNVGRYIHYRYFVINSDDETTWLKAVALITGFTDNQHVIATIQAAWPSLVVIPAGGWRLTVMQISGLGHLEGETVDICADGAYHSQKVVAGGVINLDEAAGKVHVGLPCPSVLRPMPLNQGSADGSGQGKTGRISRAILRFFESIGAKYGKDASSLKQIPEMSGSALMDTAMQMYTGDVLVDWPDGYEGENNIVIVQDKPLPCTVVALMPQFTLQDSR